MPAFHGSIILAQPAASFGSRVIQILREVIARTRRRRSRAIVAAHFERLPDYLLTDIGLTRDRVSPPTGDPCLGLWQRRANLW